MCEVHLTYFDLRALGEPIRMLLTYGNIPFEETRVPRSEWPEIKKGVPMGQLPLLKIDGLELYQSRVICKYLAKKMNLNGDTGLDELQIDIAADTIYDFITKLRIPREFDDPVAQEKKREELTIGLFQFYLRKLDEMVKKNKGNFVNGKLTWVDFYFSAAHAYFSYLARFNILEGYPNLKLLVEKIHSLPQLQEYLKNRPETQF